jgi:hypothetical protein
MRDDVTGSVVSRVADPGRIGDPLNLGEIVLDTS